MTLTEPSWSWPDFSDDDDDIQVIDVKPASKPKTANHLPDFQCGLKRKKSSDDDKINKKTKIGFDRAETAIRAIKQDRTHINSDSKGKARDHGLQREQPKRKTEDRDLAQDEIKAIRRDRSKMPSTTLKSNTPSSLATNQRTNVSRPPIRSDSHKAPLLSTVRREGPSEVGPRPRQSQTLPSAPRSTTMPHAAESRPETLKRADANTSVPLSTSQSFWSKVSKPKDPSNLSDALLLPVQSKLPNTLEVVSQERPKIETPTPALHDPKPPTSSSPPNTSRPPPIFLEFSDSDDDMPPPKAQATQVSFKKVVRRMTPSPQELERQRQESSRMRQAALEKKHSVTPGSTAGHESLESKRLIRPAGFNARKDAANLKAKKETTMMDSDLPKKETPSMLGNRFPGLAFKKEDVCTTRKTASSPEGQSILDGSCDHAKTDQRNDEDAKPQLHRAQQSSTTFQKALSDHKPFVEQIRPRSENVSLVMPSTIHGIANMEQLAPRVESMPPTRGVSSNVGSESLQSSVSALDRAKGPQERVETGNKSVQDEGVAEAERIKAKRAENQRKRDEQLAASIRAQSDAEKKAEQDAKQKEVDLQRSKEAGAKARKEVDDKREAEHRQREAQKKQGEERKWIEGRSAREKLKGIYKKRQEQRQRDASAVAERSSIASLLNIIPPPPKSEPPKVETPIQPPFEPHLDVANPAAIPANAEQASRKKSGQDTDVAAEGKETAHHDVVTTQTESASDLAREQRIKAKKERNARIQEAENAEEEQVEDVEQPLPQVFKPLAKGPVSLNSAAGQALLACANTQSRSGPAESTKNDTLRRSHSRPLGEILPQDIQMVKWHDDDWNYRDIAYTMEKQFSISRHIDTIRKRISQVRGAVHAAGVSTVLLDAVISGDQNARWELNRQVHGQWPLPGTRPQNAPPRIFAAAPSVTKADSAQHSHRAFEDNSATSTTVASPAYHLPEPAAAGERSQYGAKTINADSHKYWMQISAEEHATQEGEEDEAEEAARRAREPSPITTLDYCHFVYHVNRRFISNEEIFNGETIDDKDPVMCSGEFDSLAEANVEVCRQVLRVFPGQPVVATSGEWNMKNKTAEDGRTFRMIDNPEVGKLEVWVARSLRAHQDAIFPTSKEGWAPRTVFCIKKRTTERKNHRRVDELFDEGEIMCTSEKELEKVVGHIYTTLEEANLEAAKFVVDQSFVSTSAHLGRREQERRQREMELLEEFDHEEGEMFYNQTKVGDTSTEVFVEECGLMGPRNIF